MAAQAGRDSAETRAEQPAEEAPPNALLLAVVLREAPPTPLIKDDEPLDDDGNPTGVDRFGASEIAERLARIIEQAEPPYTISLSGQWGVGKTWVAKRLQPLLRNSQIPVVEVDLWTEDIAELRRTLAVEVSVQLAGKTDPKKMQVLREAAAGVLDRELRRPEVEVKPPSLSFAALRTPRAILTAVVAAALGALVWLGLAQPAPLPGSGPNLVASTLITLGTAGLVWLLLQSGLVLSVSAPTSTLAPIRETVGLRKIFARLVTAHPERKVLVILDNLDRLTGADAVNALGEVRSFVELRKSRCLFLVPLDRGALEGHLRRTLGGDEQAARDYLDKFFNLDLLLTQPAAADLRESILGLLSELFPGVSLEDLTLVAEVVAEAAAGSPRTAKRIANGIYARAYLLPTEAHQGINLVDVAFIESLMAKFPVVINQLSGDPSGSMRRIGELRRDSSPDTRLEVLMWLTGLPYEPEGDARSLAHWKSGKWRQVQQLADFLLFTNAIEPTADVVRTILTVRPNRQFARVPNAEAAAEALRTGDAAGLAAALGGISGEERRAALAALLDILRSDLSHQWSTGFRNGLNALAPVVTGEAHLARSLREAAAEYLLHASPADFRTFKEETIRFVFPNGARGVRFGRQIAEKSVAALAAPATVRASVDGAVRFVATTADALGPKKLDEARGALAKLSDEQLTPLFAPGANANLLEGAVCDLYVARLAAMDGTSDFAPLELAAERLSHAQVAMGWDGSAELEPVFARATALLSSGTLKESALPMLDRVVSLSAGAAFSPTLDTLAQQFVALVTGDSRPVELALKIPTSPGVLEPALTSLLNGQSAKDFIALATSQRVGLEEKGVKVSEIAAARWAAGQGKEYVDVALVDGGANSLDATFSALAAVGDSSTYPNLIQGVTDRILQLRSADGAKRIVGDIASRVATFGPAAIGQLAPDLARLQNRASPGQVLNEIATALGGITRAEISMGTSVARAFVDAGVKGAEVLPPVVARHGAAEGIADLANLGWLLEQPGVDPEDAILGLRGAIKTESQAEVHGALEAISQSRRKRWGIGLSLLERAANEPPGSRELWLADAAGSSVPSRRQHPGEREAYEDALNRAVEGDPQTNDAARALRRKL